MSSAVARHRTACERARGCRGYVSGCSETLAAVRFKRHTEALYPSTFLPLLFSRAPSCGAQASCTMSTRPRRESRAAARPSSPSSLTTVLLQVPKQGTNIKPTLVRKPVHCSFEYIHTLGCTGYVFGCPVTPDGMRERADAEGMSSAVARHRTACEKRADAEGRYPAVARHRPACERERMQSGCRG